MKNKLLLLILLVSSFFAKATTWDEPWQSEIFQNADYYVLGEILSSSETQIQVKVLNSFGKKMEGTISIDNFYLLDLCSSSGGHGPEFHFEKGDKGYFFLKKGKNGNYQLPTPTSGFDEIREEKVSVTFRHSYHRAIINVSL